MSPQRQLGLLWGTVALLLVGLAPLGGRLIGALPGCPLKSLSGVACPSCGVSRSALFLASFEPVAALQVNPLATVAWCALIGGGLVAAGLALLGRPLVEPCWQAGLVTRWVLAASVLVNWIYLVWAGV